MMEVYTQTSISDFHRVFSPLPEEPENEVFSERTPSATSRLDLSSAGAAKFLLTEVPADRQEDERGKEAELLEATPSGRVTHASSASTSRDVAPPATPPEVQDAASEGASAEEDSQSRDDALSTRVVDDDDDDDDDDADTIIDYDHQPLSKADLMELLAKQHSDDEDYETDLEFDEEKWLYPDRVDHDTTGKNKYVRVCNEIGVGPVTYFLKHIQDRELVMRFHGLGPACTKAISVPLETNTTIEKLNLEGNGITGDGAIVLSRVLKENLYLTELVLAENRIGTMGAMAVFELLLSNRSLVKIDLSGNDIGDCVAQKVYEVLLNNTVLKRLYLAHNHFEETGAKWFKDALVDNESLELLDLSWNHFSTRGSILLAQGLQENVGLKYFNMAMAGLSKEGAQAVGVALKNNRTLLELDISFSRIPAEGLPFIAAGLAENDVLTVIKLGSNPFDSDVACLVLKALEENESSAIKHADFSNVLVKGDFLTMARRLGESRDIKVTYEGILSEPPKHRKSVEEMVRFRRDPLGQFRQYVKDAGRTPSDLLPPSNTAQLTQEELTAVIKDAELDMSDDQINILFSKLQLGGKIHVAHLLQSFEATPPEML